MRYNRKSNNKNRNSRCDINLTKKCAYRIVKKKTKARKKVSIHNRRKLKVNKKNNRTNELDKKKKKEEENKSQVT